MKYLTIIAVVFFLGACERQVTIDIPPHERKMVLNTLFQDGSNPEIHLSKSLGILDRSYEFESINDANVSISVNGTPYGMTSMGDGYYDLTAVTLAAGEQVELNISHPVLDAVSGSTVVPPVVVPSGFELSQSSIAGEDNIQARIRIVDPPGPNFYAISLEYAYDVFTSDTAWGEEWLTSSDPSLLNASEGFHTLIAKDELFDGQVKEFVVETYSYLIDTAIFRLNLFSIDEAVYNAFRTNQLNYFSSENPFAQPVLSFSNVEGGYGLVGGLSKYSKGFRIY